MTGPVNDSEQVCKTFGGWQGAHQVYMDVAETAGWYWNVLRRYLNMAVDLGPLAA
jgi:hypothetical protein